MAVLPMTKCKYELGYVNKINHVVIVEIFKKTITEKNCYEISKKR